MIPDIDNSFSRESIFRSQMKAIQSACKEEIVHQRCIGWLQIGCCHKVGLECIRLFMTSLYMQLICAVDYCHKLGIMHRDLKLENTLLSDRTPDATIKLCDFG